VHPESRGTNPHGGPRHGLASPPGTAVPGGLTISMLHLTLLTTDPLPKGPFQELGRHFKKQLSSYTKFKERIVGSNEALKRAVAKQKETGDLIVVLEATGEPLTSESFAKCVRAWDETGQHVTVILGGAKGLSDHIKSSADLLLSLSAMTTTHDLAHLFFLEQLYRAMTIVHGKTYHY